MYLRKINLYAGIILLLGFLATGMYLKLIFKTEHLNDTTARMEIRANHIYILFVSLLNILSFTIQPGTGRRILKRLEIFTRILLLTAGGLSLGAFFLEHSGTLQGRLLTFLCVLSSLAGVLLLQSANLLSARLETRRD